MVRMYLGGGDDALTAVRAGWTARERRAAALVEPVWLRAVGQKQLQRRRVGCGGSEVEEGGAGEACSQLEV